VGKISDEILELIPFSPVPSKKELEEIASYNPTSKNERMRPDFIGYGASREVYALEAEPENYVLKIQRVIRDRKFGNQCKTEIQAFLSYAAVRRWMPQVYSFDTTNYRWLVSERCIMNKKAVNDHIAEFSSKTSNEVIIRLKELGMSREKLLLFNRVLKSQKPYETREAIIACVNNSRHFPNRKSVLEFYKKENFSGIALVNLLWNDLQKQNPPTLEKYVHPLEHSKGIVKRNKKISRGKRLENARKQDTAWHILLDVLSYCHPFICEISLETLNTNVYFRDLHSGNIGISKVKKKPFDLRIIDLGLIRRNDTSTGKRKTPSQLQIPETTASYKIVENALGPTEEFQETDNSTQRIKGFQQT